MIAFSLSGFTQTHYGNLTDFAIVSSYLDNGKVTINSATSSTAIQFTASFSRETSSYPNWKNFSMTVVLGTVKNGSPVYFSNPQTITNSDFSSGNYFLTKTFNATINKTDLSSGQKIMLFYQTSDMDEAGYYMSTLYDFIMTSSGAGPSEPAPDYLPTWFLPPAYANSRCVYRIRRPSNNKHFLTASLNEAITLVDGPWDFEAHLGFLRYNQESGTVPLYRYYRYQNQDHYFTTSSSTPGGYTNEGIAGYVYTSQVANSHPIYVYSPYAGGDHLYTSNWSELGNGNGTWRYDGIAFYLLN
jgi:hypothetical protein